MSAWLILPDDWIAEADEVAVKRHDNARRNNRQPRNGAPDDDEAALGLSILGTRCERACKAYLDPIYWHAFVENGITNLPDLGDFIDAKGVPTDSRRIVLQKDDKEDWAYVLVSAQRHPLYLLKGWAWGNEIKRDEYWRDPTGNNRHAYFYDGELRAMGDLFDIVRGRK
jgi:hypothetical protein